MADPGNEREQIIRFENLFAEKKYGGLLPLTEQALKDFPESFQIKLLHIKILMELARLEEAEVLVQDMLNKFPDNIKLLVEGGNLYLKQEKYSQAQEFYEKILFHDPFNLIAKKGIQEIDQIKEERENKVSIPVIKHEEEPIPPPEIISQGEIIKWESEEKQPEKVTVEVQPLAVNEPPIPATPDPEVIEQRDPFEESDINIEFAGVTEETGIPIPELELSVADLENSDKADQEIKEAPMATESQLKEFTASVLEQEVASQPEEKVKIPDTLSEEEIEAALTEERGSPEVAEEQYEPDAEAAENLDFVTESAAELYISQGLFDDALLIYEKLYILNKEDKLIAKIEWVKRKRVIHKQIEALEGYLTQIKERGESVV